MLPRSMVVGLDMIDWKCRSLIFRVFAVDPRVGAVYELGVASHHHAHEPIARHLAFVQTVIPEQLEKRHLLV
jgi:hypothetical protein